MTPNQPNDKLRSVAKEIIEMIDGPVCVEIEPCKYCGVNFDKTIAILQRLELEAKIEATDQIEANARRHNEVVKGRFHWSVEKRSVVYACCEELKKDLRTQLEKVKPHD